MVKDMCAQEMCDAISEKLREYVNTYGFEVYDDNGRILTKVDLSYIKAGYIKLKFEEVE